MTGVAVVGPDDPSAPELEAMRILVERLLRRGIDAVVADVPPAEGAHIIVGTPSSSTLVRAAVERGDFDLAGLGGEGYVLARLRDAVFVSANDAPAVVFAVGRLLREGWPASFNVITSTPALPVRNIYFADHMGNWYSHAPEVEVFEYLDEMALWGYNELMTCVAVKQGETFVDAVERVRGLEDAARRLGMRAGPVVQSNTSYVGPAPEHRATPVPIAAPYDVCASQPGASDFLVSDKRDYLALMAPFDYICLWPYDGGGCACDACAPWGKTFLELSERIAREALPDETDVWVSAWFFEKWASGEDDALFSDLD
ncbi:MAG TPA: hypothetical protein VMY34_08580, partial [Acidimicrobiales bacterium]|nr:hypothetical protein [Acidimicrobiales bacterium]